MILSIQEFIGHFHPVLVHLPIGILIMAGVFEWLSRKEKYISLNKAVEISLLLGMLAAIASCISGLLLSQSGDYDEQTVDWHKWLGITVACIAALSWYCKKKQKLVAIHFPLTIILFLLIIITGHLGGTLTHGDGYLINSFNSTAKDVKETKPLIADVQNAFLYKDLVAPLLQAKCYNCHGEKKQKGKLRLDNIADLLKGGKDGKIIDTVTIEKSEILKRLLLPKEDEHHMPPKEKGQLTAAEINLLHFWIQNGLSADKKVNQFNQTEKEKQWLASFQGDDNVAIRFSSDIPDTPVEKPDEAVIEQLKNNGVVVTQVAKTSNYLSVNFITATNTGDKEIALLEKLKIQLIWLKLPNAKLSDAAFASLGKLTRLIKLDISNTAITDKSLSQLNNLTQLQSLNLVGTNITAIGLSTLKDLKKLKHIYLFKSGTDKHDFAMLKKIFPDAAIDTGGYQVPLLHEDTILIKPIPKK